MLGKLVINVTSKNHGYGTSHVLDTDNLADIINAITKVISLTKSLGGTSKKLTDRTITYPLLEDSKITIEFETIENKS